MYKKIEELADYNKIHEVIADSLEPFHERLNRVPTEEDREKLLSIQIRRISRFDIGKNEEDIHTLEKELDRVERDLKNIKKVAINYLRHLIDKYGKVYPRRTQIQQIEQIDRRAIETRMVKIGYDPKTGFLGTKVVSDNYFECTNFDKVLIMFQDGSYTVINIPEKQYVHKDNKKVAFVGAADKKTIINVAYKDPKSHLAFAKRFIIDKFLLDKPYRYIEEGMDLVVLSTQSLHMELVFIPKARQKTSSALFNFDQVLVKGVAAKGIRMAPRPIKKMIQVAKS